MILYTTMPTEMIFPNEADYTKQTVIEMNGISMVVEKTENQEYRVIRLLSTDPNQYLNGSFTPGQTIPLKPQI